MRELSDGPDGEALRAVQLDLRQAGSPQRRDDSIAMNLMAAVRCSRAALPHLRRT